MHRFLPLYVLSITASFTIGISAAANAGPVVLCGRDFPAFIGVPLGNLRIVDGRGVAIPFQIDEKTLAGDYIGNGGTESNADSAHATLQNQDEIAFLAEDAAPGGGRASGGPGIPGRAAEIAMTRDGASITAYLVNDPAIRLSPVGYISYDARGQCIRTPWYYAQFGPNRFHFTGAGIAEPGSDRYLDLTRELRIEIVLKTLWGILPVRYNQDNIVCTVRRYKIGPIRLIRRGDFFLMFGFFGLKGSRAVVYQTCYPQAVEVPVHVHLPIRLGALFSEAYIEMTPVFPRSASGFAFSIPSLGATLRFAEERRIDTLIGTVPDRGYLVSDGTRGFAWMTRFGVSEDHLRGSGYIFRRSPAQGPVECGVRYVLRDLPKGDYTVANWVLFPRPCTAPAGGDCMNLFPGTTVSVSGKKTSDLFGAPFAGERLRQ